MTEAAYDGHPAHSRKNAIRDHRHRVQRFWSVRQVNEYLPRLWSVTAIELSRDGYRERRTPVRRSQAGPDCKRPVAKLGRRTVVTRRGP